MRKEKDNMQAQLDMHRSRAVELGKAEQELKAKIAKMEQSTEKSLKALRDKIKQLENMLRLKDSELDQMRAKFKASEAGKDQVSLQLTKVRKSTKEKEWERKLLDKDKEIKYMHVIYRKLQIEVIETKRQVAELEYNEKVRMESMSAKTLQKKELEVEELKLKNANLLSLKIKLEQDNDEARSELSAVKERMKPLMQVNNWVRTHLGPNPKEFLNRVQSLRESLKFYETKVRKLADENSQLKERLSYPRPYTAKAPFTECSNTIQSNNLVNPEHAAILLNEVGVVLKVKTPEEVVEGVKKMSQVVKAAQRMEHFIKLVCDIVLQTEAEKDIDVTSYKHK
eukprot:TRINITY_DN5045_c0_g4_i1.p1 TRINITY_DN5045_c0_g4~~TRINITY_DN5045_c0_g4_i1.p1  ORF type:complete len:339 (-),score=98.76 TRINITY_DN5045_c0_g4_i1:642-1658(-)